MSLKKCGAKKKIGGNSCRFHNLSAKTSFLQSLIYAFPRQDNDGFFQPINKSSHHCLLDLSFILVCTCDVLECGNDSTTIPSNDIYRNSDNHCCCCCNCHNINNDSIHPDSICSHGHDMATTAGMGMGGSKQQQQQ